jgi:hypothetical protein
MSLFKEEHLECPFCHQDVPFILHHSINVGIHPEHRAKVLDSTLFRYQCPHCKQTDEVCYPTLYHDPENEIMIQVLWREEDFGQPMDKELQSLIEVMGQKNYRRREVFGYCELVEKIRIFDARLDDFAISLLKTLYKIQNQEMQLFFHEKTDEGFVLYSSKEMNCCLNALILMKVPMKPLCNMQKNGRNIMNFTNVCGWTNHIFMMML